MVAKLILVGGSLATGKSTLSKKIANALKIQRVSLDEIKEVLFDVGGYRDRAWSKEIGRLAFPVFRDLIELHLRRGESVVAEATFLWPTDCEWLHAFSQTYEAELVQIWLTSYPVVARERFIERANSTRHPGHNDSLESVLEEFDRRFFNKTFIPLPIDGKTKIVDTTDFTTIDHDEILRWI
ncbi:ATP-binding protein [Patescibacteria group bacterium]|nr:MAG: ATP-binding protein [Patescibacteria group bacterium]